MKWSGTRQTLEQYLLGAGRELMARERVKGPVTVYIVSDGCFYAVWEGIQEIEI